MPIEAVTADALRVKKLHVGVDGSGRFLSCNCSFAETFVFCFGGEQLKTRENLRLSEEELIELYNGGQIRKEDCRLQGVPGRVFSATPSFRNFQVTPPEQIQAWSMTKRQDGKAVLYVPDVPGGEVCNIPLHFKVVCTEGTVTSLKIEMQESETGKYQEGALLYRVGKSCPIPVPGACINTTIRIRTDGQPVRVVVEPSFEGKYQEI